MQQLIPATHKYKIPDWLVTVPDTTFAPGPKQLYKYLLVFGGTGCWQYNYRLAERFKVSSRTIQLWINWLKAHNLVRVKQPYNRRRRVYAYSYDQMIHWLGAECFTTATKAIKQAYLSAKQADARRQLLLEQLSPRNTSPILPFPNMPTPTHGG